MENELRKQKLSKLALINEQLVSLLPDSFSSKAKLIDWLNSNPYSPYVTLYGGENALLYNQEKSFISPTDGKNRFIMEDEFSFKLENFTSFDNQILSANEPLSKIINCKQLFKNYPEFQNLEININISNANNGYFSGNTLYSNNKANKINIFASNNKEAMRVLLHELQHCIQLKEGFKIGTSYYNEHGVMDLFVGLNKTQSIDEIKNTLSKDTMFSDEVLFKEVFENHEYFNENKDGLKAKLIYIDPYDYIEAVNKVKPKHKHSEDKLQSLKNAYDNGIKVPVPYLTYGSRDEASSDFGQEGYNRAVHATYIGRRTIPVFVRYRENDENIPQAIKNAIDFEKSSFSDIATKKSMVEIDSSKAIINMDILSSSKTRILGDVLNYDTLYTKYPTLYGLKVNVLNIDSHAAYGKNEITISQNLIDKGNVEEIKSSLIHEIQHAIQNIENWARGGSPDEFKNQKELKDLLTQQYEDLQKEIGYEDWQNNLMFNDFDKYCHLLDLGRSNYSLVPFYQEFIKDKKLDKETASYFLFKMDYFNTQIKQIAHSVNPNDYYLRLWGEQQARASQYRLNLSDKEREKENWIGTLQKVEGKYSEPIIKYSESNSFNINIPQHQEIVINHFKNIEKKNLISFLEDKIIDDIKSIQKEKDFYKTFNTKIEDFKNLYPDTKKEIISSLSSYENYADLNHNKIFSDILINVLNDKNENIIEAIKKYENLDIFKESNYDLIAAIKKHGLTINEDNIMLSFVAPKENEIGAFSDIATKTTMVELDSSKSKLHNNISKIIKDDKITTLENILIYDELFNRYPELKNIEVRFVDGSDIEKGSYNRNKNLITINNGISNSDDILSTLLHEVQHVIQNIENWARGGSIKEFEHNLDENTINIMLQNLGEAIFIKEIANKYKCEIENLNFKENTYEYDILKNKNAVRLAKNNSLEWMKKEYENYSTNSEMKYISLWGEQQARAVQFRLKMHLEDRLNENWTETLKKVEGQYKEPIIKYNNIDIANNTETKQNEEIILYHGTNAIFDKFEKMGNRLTSIGTGHYFTPDLNIAKQYGKHIKSIKINKNDILDLDNPTKAQKESIIKLLDEVVPNEIKAGYGEVKKIDITTMEDKEAIALYKQKKEETKNLWHDRAKAQIVEDFETKKAYIQWQEVGLQNATTQNIKNLIQEYRQSIPKELGYKIAKSGSEIAIYDTNLVNQNLIEDKKVSNNSKIANEDGSPKVFYHGTSANFTSFKINTEKTFDAFGSGIYFTDKRNKAEHYGEKVIEVHLNMNNPLYINDNRTIWNNIIDNHLGEEWSNEVKKLGYDGIIVNKDYQNIVVAFEPSQINIINQATSIDIEKESSREKNFNEWFGNSKVVDINGNPLVVYHGSLTSFDTFDTSFGELSFFGRGGYFSSSQKDADIYASKNPEINFDLIGKAENMAKELEIPYSEAREEVTRGNEQVYPVYLSIQNPLEIGGFPIEATIKELENSLRIAQKNHPNFLARKIKFLSELDISNEKALYDSAWKLGAKYEINRYDDLIKKIIDGKRISDIQLELMGGDGARELMITQNKDGIIHHNIDNTFKYMDIASKHYFVRNPTQIKSIYNIGTFDKNNPKILEKNDLGLRNLEMIMSIIPNNMNMDTVKDYLFFNNITHEQLRGTIYNDILNSPKFDASKIRIPNTNSIDFDTAYFQSAGEKESREIESLYIHQDLNNLLAP